MIHKIIRLFANTLTVDDKHYLLNRHNLRKPIQIQLSKKQKTFLQFAFSIFKVCIKFLTFVNKMTLIADVFPEIPPPKSMVR